MQGTSDYSRLSAAIDALIVWYADWQRLAMSAFSARAEGAETLSLPDTLQDLVFDERFLPLQPMLEKMRQDHARLQQMARLVLIKSPDMSTVAPGDMAAFASAYIAFMRDLRKTERALSAAAAGLDTLTGLHTRAGLGAYLEREQSRVRCGGLSYGLVMMDLDHFKSINDTHGHDAGDRVLSAAAGLVVRSLRPFDDVWRVGGEEILLCLKDVTIQTAPPIVERLRAELETLPVALEGPEAMVLNVTASFGLALAGPNDTVEGLMQRADAALYKAKDGGRNRVVVG